jgi:hypothetical protein
MLKHSMSLKMRDVPPCMSVKKGFKPVDQMGYYSVAYFQTKLNERGSNLDQLLVLKIGDP